MKLCTIYKNQESDFEYILVVKGRKNVSIIHVVGDGNKDVENPHKSDKIEVVKEVNAPEWYNKQKIEITSAEMNQYIKSAGASLTDFFFVAYGKAENNERRRVVDINEREYRL